MIRNVLHLERVTVRVVNGHMTFETSTKPTKYAAPPAPPRRHRPSPHLQLLCVQDPGSDGSPGLSGEAAAGTAVGGLHSGGQDAVRRMLQLLGPQQEHFGGGTAAGADATGGGASSGVGTSVEDFPPLLGESYLRASTHSTATRMRSRLFQVPGRPVDSWTLQEPVLVQATVSLPNDVQSARCSSC